MKKKNFGIGVGFAAVLFTAIVLIAFKADEVRQTAAMPAVPQISASQAILVEAETGEVLYERNARERAYPASTTKIMTALLVLETLERYDSPIDQVVTVPREAEGVEGSSLYLKAGEKIRLEDLLYGLMLQSGNDSAVALAILTAGSTENFVAEMNAKAEELGCGNTHFVNPNGLFDENHYTTAWDWHRSRGKPCGIRCSARLWQLRPGTLRGRGTTLPIFTIKIRRFMNSGVETG